MTTAAAIGALCFAMPVSASAQNTMPVVAPLQPGYTGSQIVITRSVWNQYVVYVHSVASSGYGFFMVTVDGATSGSYVCADYACQINPIEKSTALEGCKQSNQNRRCVLFAEGRAIKIAYQIAPQ